MDFIEIFGTLASVIIAISLTMKNLKRLRLLNLLGSVAFAVYGLKIGSTPVFLVNLFIVGIDGWYLVRMRLERSHFSLLHVPGGDSEYLRAFLDYHKADISRFAPEFSPELSKGCEAIFILRDTVPASLILWRRGESGDVEILLDYASPAYRDYKNAEYFFQAAAGDITKGGEARYYQRSSTPAHISYLKRLGFTPAADGASSLPGKGALYEKTVRMGA